MHLEDTFSGTDVWLSTQDSAWDPWIPYQDVGLTLASNFCLQLMCTLGSSRQWYGPTPPVWGVWGMNQCIDLSHSFCFCFSNQQKKVIFTKVNLFWHKTFLKFVTTGFLLCMSMNFLKTPVKHVKIHTFRANLF